MSRTKTRGAGADLFAVLRVVRVVKRTSGSFEGQSPFFLLTRYALNLFMEFGCLRFVWPHDALRHPFPVRQPPRKFVPNSPAILPEQREFIFYT